MSNANLDADNQQKTISFETWNSPEATEADNRRNGNYMTQTICSTREKRSDEVNQFRVLLEANDKVQHFERFYVNA